MAFPDIFSSRGCKWIESTEKKSDSVSKSSYESFICWAWTRAWTRPLDSNLDYQWHYKKHSKWELCFTYGQLVFSHLWHSQCWAQWPFGSEVRTSMVLNINIISDPFNTSTTSNKLHIWWIRLMGITQTWARCKERRVSFSVCMTICWSRLISFISSTLK